MWKELGLSQSLFHSSEENRSWNENWDFNMRMQIWGRRFILWYNKTNWKRGWKDENQVHFTSLCCHAGNRVLGFDDLWGVLLGVGPASATIMSLYAENGMNYKDYHWSRAWDSSKENLVPANQVFYTFFTIGGILLYGMYLWSRFLHLNFFQEFWFSCLI